MNATAVTVATVPQIAAPIDHVALDVILTHLERRYGLDSRIDRAYRIVVSDRVEICADEPTTGLVHGDSGRDYYATADGFCECPDAERVARCKHSLAVVIAVQLASVAKSKASADEDARATFARLTREHQDHGRALTASGQRPADDAVYAERDDQIQALRNRLPVDSLIR